MVSVCFQASSVHFWKGVVSYHRDKISRFNFRGWSLNVCLTHSLLGCAASIEAHADVYRSAALRYSAAQVPLRAHKWIAYSWVSTCWCFSHSSRHNHKGLYNSYCKILWVMCVMYPRTSVFSVWIRTWQASNILRKNIHYACAREFYGTNRGMDKPNNWWMCKEQGRNLCDWTLPNNKCSVKFFMENSKRLENTTMLENMFNIVWFKQGWSLWWSLYTLVQKCFDMLYNGYKMYVVYFDYEEKLQMMNLSHQ